MADRGQGRVIFVASVAGLRGSAYVAPYVASKHGVVGLMKSLSAELLKTGVTVNAICPGYVQTEMLEESIRRVMEKTGRSEEEARRGFAEINPNHRLVQPEEVAAAAMWLVSDAAVSVTGQAIAISGGA
jgi:NAD(P)-dependent dehydrogenase (short-subunit alcohol dehydrogenase family)